MWSVIMPSAISSIPTWMLYSMLSLLDTSTVSSYSLLCMYIVAHNYMYTLHVHWHMLYIYMYTIYVLSKSAILLDEHDIVVYMYMY